jgi:Na+-driven multidrug efflux pump
MSRTATRNLTQGSPLRLILSFASPLLFGFLFQQFYSFVDTAIVGKVLGAASWPPSVIPARSTSSSLALFRVRAPAFPFPSPRPSVRAMRPA